MTRRRCFSSFDGQRGRSSRKSRALGCNSQVWFRGPAVLNREKPKSSARWPSAKQPYRWDLGKVFRALVRSLGMADVRLHDLRHTGPSVLLMQGIPGDVVRRTVDLIAPGLVRTTTLTSLKMAAWT